MGNLVEFRAALQKLGSPEKARLAARYFKTGAGEYGAGDTFIGVTVPMLRKLATSYEHLSMDDLETLLTGPIHEERMAALLILVRQFGHGDEQTKRSVYDFYISHTEWVNNWDLVDCSAEYIVGSWLEDKNEKILETLAHSPLVWERRIALLATFHYIKQGDSIEALKIISIVLHDKHDLIQKATGWMLREIGKRCGEDIEKGFLDKYYKTMPRTTLRYAIERLPANVRAHYLARQP